MLIAEDLVLLLLDDDDGTLSASSQAETALGGAVLAELALAGCVEVGEKEGFWHTAKVRATGTPPADPLLGAAHATVAEKERSAQDLVGRLGRGLVEQLGERLQQRGLVERREHKVLGLFRTTRWPATDTTYEAGVRQALTATLVQGLDPDPRTGTLVALLAALDQAHRVVDEPGLSRRDVKKRAQEIAEGQWAAEGVADAIAATNAAVLTAITVSAATAATTSSGS